MIFTDRTDAGEQLARQLQTYKAEKPLVLALPRGGVPVAAVVAKELAAPLSVIIARKIGAPSNPEFGIGAISENDVFLLDNQIVNSLQLQEPDVEHIIEKETHELDRRAQLYRNGHALPDMADRVVLIVDDGVATGVTMRAAIQAVQKMKPQKIIGASPVCADDTAQQLQAMCDSLVCVHRAKDLQAIGSYYKQFNQVSDDAVIDCLNKTL
jgi:predicted phosphoribosyltransferase